MKYLCKNLSRKRRGGILVGYYGTLCKQHASIVGSAVHAYLLHSICACGQINQLAKRLVSLLAVSLKRLVNSRSQIQNVLLP